MPSELTFVSKSTELSNPDLDVNPSAETASISIFDKVYSWGASMMQSSSDYELAKLYKSQAKSILNQLDVSDELSNEKTAFLNKIELAVDSKDCLKILSDVKQFQSTVEALESESMNFTFGHAAMLGGATLAGLAIAKKFGTKKESPKKTQGISQSDELALTGGNINNLQEYLRRRGEVIEVSAEPDGSFKVTLVQNPLAEEGYILSLRNGDVSTLFKKREGFLRELNISEEDCKRLAMPQQASVPRAMPLLTQGLQHTVPLMGAARILQHFIFGDVNSPVLPGVGPLIMPQQASVPRATPLANSSSLQRQVFPLGGVAGIYQHSLLGDGNRFVLPGLGGVRLLSQAAQQSLKDLALNAADDSKDGSSERELDIPEVNTPKQTNI